MSTSLCERVQRIPHRIEVELTRDHVGFDPLDELSDLRLQVQGSAHKRRRQHKSGTLRSFRLRALVESA